MRSANKALGIITYIDNSATMLEDFSWLYKSWIFSGCWHTSTLIVVHHPALTGQFPDDPNLILIPLLPHSQTEPLFRDYHFINSIACLSGPHIDEVMKEFQWVLRTDADVFLTHHLAGFEPVFPVHGRGNYHFMEDFRLGMLDFCKRHRVSHHQRFGCGHSVMMRADMMVNFLQRQMHWARRLAEDFGPDKANWGKWPGWFRGVLSMYAAEIAANERFGEYLQNGRERILDMESCNEGRIDSLTLHIHAVHGSTLFSKFKFRAGEYQAIDPQTLDRRCINQYCLWIAMTDVEEIKTLAGYSA